MAKVKHRRTRQTNRIKCKKSKGHLNFLGAIGRNDPGVLPLGSKIYDFVSSPQME
jgi:hypothetical protein